MTADATTMPSAPMAHLPRIATAEEARLTAHYSELEWARFKVCAYYFLY